MVAVKRLYPLLLVALALRLPGMFQSLWYDEAFTLYLAGLDIPHLITATAGDVHPPLYYLIAWLSCHIFGLNEWGVRLPALLFGLALIPSVDVLFDSLAVSGRLKTVSLWLTATAPMLIQYSAEARMYTLLGLIACWAVIMAVRGNWAGLVVCITAGMYTQNTFVLMIPVLLMLSQTTTLLAGAMAVLLYSPWVPVVWWQLVNVNANYWIPEISLGRATYILYRVISGPGHHEAIVWITGPMVLLMLVAGTWQLRYNRKLLAVALLPFGVACLISLFTPILIERILISSVPAMLVLCAAGALWVVDRMRNKWEAYPLLLAWTVAVVTVIMTPTNSDLRGRYQALNVQPGDVCYHINASTLITVAYVLPQCDNYIWPANQTLDESITNKTKTGMGLKQVAIEDVPPGHIWLFHYTGPHLLGAEFAEQKRILSLYPPLETVTVQNDSFIATTTVWRLTADEYAGRN